MTDAPERIWAKAEMEYGGVIIGRFADTVRYLTDGTEYIRADIVAELQRQLGGGCEANVGGDHLVIKEGSYAFCGKCGESLRGVRYCHLPQTTSATAKVME